jgi:hypothetical protein
MLDLKMDSEYTPQINYLYQISPSVKMYLDDKTYLTKWDEDDLNLHTLLFELYDLARFDLNVFGILVDDQMTEDGYLSQSIIFLLDLFNLDSLYQWYQTLTQEAQQIATQLFNSDEISFIDLMDFMIDTKYELIYVNPGMLREHLDNLLNLIKVINISDDDENYENVLIFLKYKRAHIRDVRLAAEALMGIAEVEANEDYLNQQLKIHDKDLLDPQVLNIEATRHHYKTSTNSHLRELVGIFSNVHEVHERNNSHHIEYYLERREIQITITKLIELMSDLYDRHDTTNQLEMKLNHLMNDIESYDLSIEDRAVAMFKDFKEAMVNLLNQDSF